MNMIDSPFTADEIAAQTRAGGPPRGHGIRDHLIEQHSTFYAGLAEVFLASTDSQGWPVATLLEGTPGFVHSPDPRQLRVHALPAPEDPAHDTLQPGCEVGLLGIDLSTRRRNRTNGILSQLREDAFSIAVRQSFGNCPQYIQKRLLQRVLPARAEMQPLGCLDARARALIEHADTFFVASRSRSGVGAAAGVDISHRGGRPGFVRVRGDRLDIPDFRGNGYFNTLGNLLGEPRSALLFLDFDTGDVLQLQGLASIDWEGGKDFEGAQRLWSFQVVQGWHRPAASRLRGALQEYSPMTLRTGTWLGRTGPSLM